MAGRIIHDCDPERPSLMIVLGDLQHVEHVYPPIEVRLSQPRINHTVLAASFSSAIPIQLENFLLVPRGEATLLEIVCPDGVNADWAATVTDGSAPPFLCTYLALLPRLFALAHAATVADMDLAKTIIFKERLFDELKAERESRCMCQMTIPFCRACETPIHVPEPTARQLNEVELAREQIPVWFAQLSSP